MMMLNSKSLISATLSIAVILGSYPQLSTARDRVDYPPIKVSQKVNISPRLKEFQEKVAKLEEKLSSYRAKGDRGGEIATLQDLGYEHRKVERYQTAVEYYDRALLISREIRNYSKESSILDSLGYVYHYLGNYQKSIEHYDRSLSISDKNINKGELSGLMTVVFQVSTLSQLGNVYQSMGQAQKAIEYHTKALSIIRETNQKYREVPNSIDLANAYQALGQSQKAIEYYERALSLAKTSDSSRREEWKKIILNNLGVTYSSLGQYPKAIEYLNRSLEIDNEKSTLINLGYAYYKSKKIADAEKLLLKSLRYRRLDINSVSMKRWDEPIAIANPYQLLQKVLVEQGKISEALEISERDRANSIARLLASKISLMDGESLAKFRRSPNITEIQAIAKQKNTTLVKYSLVEDAIYIWVISPDGKISFKQTQLPAHTKIRDLIVAARDSIGVATSQRNTANPTKFKDPLKQLYQLLIAPIAAELPQDPNDLITFVPEDELLLLPFNILQNAQGKYLIEQHTLGFSPSIQMLGFTTHNSQKKGTSVIVGNPIMPPYPNGKLSNLPGAELEAKQIGKILKVSPLIGAAADKQEVLKRMPTANFIHFASHGFYTRVAGELPGAVALTNGYLTSDEIFDLQLQADLVVFSISDDGDKNGLTVSALAPLIAGASSVLLTTCEIQDDSTQVLMTEFYHQLQVKKLPKAQAIGQAILKTKKKFEKPDKWAAFMLVGEGK
jgi:CHAT domain-containing protein/Flp pilus assembly protein TadD